ncbi:hypothetical protein ACJX0J_011599, partial [Zea mays]
LTEDVVVYVILMPHTSDCFLDLHNEHHHVESKGFYIIVSQICIFNFDNWDAKTSSPGDVILVEVQDNNRVCKCFMEFEKMKCPSAYFAQSTLHQQNNSSAEGEKNSLLLPYAIIQVRHDDEEKLDFKGGNIRKLATPRAYI